MKQPHKHAALIKAWADGAEIECWVESTMEWMHIVNPNWHEKHQYRIKPEPKTDVVTYVKATVGLALSKGIYVCLSKTAPSNNLRLTFDGETGALKKAEVLE